MKAVPGPQTSRGCRSRMVRVGFAFAIVFFCLRGETQEAGEAGAAVTVRGSADFNGSLQGVEGFGVSEAFGQAASIKALPPLERKQVLDLLFSRESGAGLNMLRLGIGTDSGLKAIDPGRADAAARYSFDGDDGGQVWMAQAARRYGLTNFTADAWTAPGFMKSNQKEIGGTLCGLADAACGTGNWSSAFSDYLLQYVRVYRQLGILIGSLGFANEPDIPVSYASMLFAPAQAVEFLNVFGPAVRRAGLRLKIACCDASNWKAAERFTAALEGDEAGESVDIVTAHEYGSHAENPLATKRPVWMTEWSSGVTSFHAEWDCGGCFGGPDGMYLANDILQAFGEGNVNAYVYWWGAGTGPASLIQIGPPAAGARRYVVAKRFYALAGISRFVRPNAVRVPASCADEQIKLVAFRNPDGSKGLVLLNEATTEVKVEFALDLGWAAVRTRIYVTDATHSLAEEGGSLEGGELRVTLPARSLTSVTLSAQGGLRKKF